MKKGTIILIIVLSLTLTTIIIKRHFKNKNMEVKDYLNLPFINKVKDNVSQFGNKVIDIANELGWNAKWLMVVMNNESNLDHKAKNPTSSATGLIQFMDKTAKSLGTTTDKLKKMTNVEQLDYVKKYLMPYKDKVSSVADAYLSVFYPLALFKPDSWEFPEWAVKANKIFDISKDGKLTKAEFKQYVNNKYSQYV